MHVMSSSSREDVKCSHPDQSQDSVHSENISMQEVDLRDEGKLAQVHENKLAEVDTETESVGLLNEGEDIGFRRSLWKHQEPLIKQLKKWLGDCKSELQSLAPFRGPFAKYLWISTTVNCILLLWIAIVSIRSWLDSCSPEKLLGKGSAWVMPAVSTAVDAFAEDCSGRGAMWSDMVGYTSVCECEPCYVGHDCSVLLDDCHLDLSNPEPLLFAEFWRLNSAASSVLLPGNFRLGYSSSGHSARSASRALEDAIRRVHSLVGNAVVEGRHLVIGAGTTGLINAALYALSNGNVTAGQEDSVQVTSAAPYSHSYESNTRFWNSRQFSWAGPTTSRALQNATTTLELVTSPNDPDGTFQEASLTPGEGMEAAEAEAGRQQLVVHNLASYWPHFAPITAPLDKDVMLFSLSKLTGHAGTRVGWAIVKDAKVAEKMQEAITAMIVGVSHESQFRAAKILTAVCDEIQRVKGPSPSPMDELDDASEFAKKGLMFSYASSLMQSRWQQLQDIFEDDHAATQMPRFSLQELGPTQFCKFFDTQMPSSPAFAWVRCNHAVDTDCYQVFKSNGILGTPGTKFGSDTKYVRLSLLMAQSTFELFMERITQIITKP